MQPRCRACWKLAGHHLLILGDFWKWSSTGPPHGAMGLFLQELGDVLVEKAFVGGACATAGGVAPERRDGEQGAVSDVLRLVLRVDHREIEVGGGGHVEDGRFDRAESLLQIAVEAGRSANVVLLPGAELQDEVVGVGAFDEVGTVLVGDLLERGGFGVFFAPEFLAPLLLRVEPRGPDDGKGLDALGGLGFVVAVLKGGVGSDGGDLAFVAHDAVPVGFGGA